MEPFKNKYCIVGVGNTNYGTNPGLSQVGHNVKRSSILHGGGQAIYIDYISGKMIGGSDKRKDGLALGL